MEDKLSLKGVNSLTVKGRVLSCKLRALVITDDEIEEIAKKEGKVSLLPINYQKRTNSDLEKSIVELQVRERKVQSQELKDVLVKLVQILREIDRVVFEKPDRSRYLDGTFENSLHRVPGFIDEYERFERSGLDSMDIKGSKQNILKALNDFVVYLGKLYSKMYDLDVLSVNADAQVFSQILSMNSTS